MLAGLAKIHKPRMKTDLYLISVITLIIITWHHNFSAIVKLRVLIIGLHITIDKQ